MHNIIEVEIGVEGDYGSDLEAFCNRTVRKFSIQSLKYKFVTHPTYYTYLDRFEWVNFYKKINII